MFVVYMHLPPLLLFNGLFCPSERLTFQPTPLILFSLMGLYLSGASSILLSLAFTLPVSLPDWQTPIPDQRRLAPDELRRSTWAYFFSVLLGDGPILGHCCLSFAWAFGPSLSTTSWWLSYVEKSC
jgi:hypothetical protein